jgi:hypothetical protein
VVSFTPSLGIRAAINSVNHEVSASVDFNYGENEETGIMYLIKLALTKLWTRDEPKRAVICVGSYPSGPVKLHTEIIGYGSLRKVTSL